MGKVYYVGLDMGTNSVGWSVTDTDYRLVKVKGKDFWGIREFDEASTSVDRRMKRISRRRRQREQVRIGLLRSYFAPEIQKEDPLFFVRMENSKYYNEDKDAMLGSKDAVFNDEDYHDADYYKQYPTIYHLRKALIEESVPHDKRYARLVYLALLNMFKHRGHFLNAGLGSGDEVVTVEQIYPEFVQLADSLLFLSFPTGIAQEMERILSDSSVSRSAKAEKMAEVCGFTKTDKKQTMLLRCICGLKVDGKRIFEDVESEDKIEICFNDFGYEDKAIQVAEAIGQENFELVEVMKQIYDAGMMANILHGKEYLSMSRVIEYEKHHEDLQLLKNVIREYKTEEEYDWMFRQAVPASYSAYVKSVNSRQCGETPVRRSTDGRTREEFYKSVKRMLKGITDERVDYILKEIDNETFLPKQLTPGNGVIPNQVHKREMAAILKQAEKHLPFLKEIDESGLSTGEHIIRLFTFQVPYYVGPVTENSAKYGGNGWVIRRESGQVLPWNMQDKIDMEKTSEEFIRRLVRNCTYLNNEKVLPKASLEYEAFCVLNEINNMKINGEKISVELKQDIYRELFCRGKRVTRKALEKYLINRGVLREASELTGIDAAINSSLASYGKFYAVFGDALNSDEVKKMAERIIYLATIYGDDRKMLKNRLKKEFGDILDDAAMKRILGYKFKDWGRFSKELLELPGCNKSTGEIKSLIRTMWETNGNFMELIYSNGYTFKEELENRQYQALSSLAEFQAEDLDDFYFSAPVKRMIWQTILLLKEIEKVMGNPPTRVFIEMTRSDKAQRGNKGRKDSRGKQLVELYQSIQGETRDWIKEIEVADESGLLRSKKLYLYYMQMGRCMYTGKPIDPEELFTTKYDIDHIYPRHYVKDDNISNNLVLVNKSSNAYKSDKYPLVKMPEEVYALWRRLHAAKLISDEKYKRLMGREPFTDEQKAGFIARQLVETSQGTKGIADLLKQLLPEPETTVVYAKGENVADFRNHYGFLKSRTVNDFHHAKDAYLNIVVGNVYYTKFTQNPLNFVKKEFNSGNSSYQYNLGKMFDRDVARDGRSAWIAPKSKTGNMGTLAVVKKVMERNTPMITRMVFEASGAIANETLYSARKATAENYIPLKFADKRMRDVTRYGGFTSVSVAYFFLVEHDGKKGKRIRTLETLPIYIKTKAEANENGLLEYCTDTLKLINPSICLRKINIQSLLRVNGYTVRLSGKTGNRITLRNEVSMCLEQEWTNYIHGIEKFTEKGVLPKEITKEKNEELYQLFAEKYTTTIYKKRPNSMGDKLTEGFESFEKLNTEEQCKVLSEVLKLSVIGLPRADLSKIGGSPNSGVMVINKNITDLKEIKLINQSVTGIYENSIDLLTV